MNGVRAVRATIGLFRLRLSLFVALSAATGHAAAAFRLSWELLLTAFACVVLAAGCSALNQYQERRMDRRMSRTRSRPIPSGHITPIAALLIATVLITAGLALLAFWCGPVGMLLGLGAVILYNGMYTWMKRRTAFAAVPGAVVGAIGPAIGWVAGGGTLSSPTLFAIAIVFFLWQVPHFWLLALNYPSDYRDAGYPDPIDKMGGDRLFRVGLMWIACTSLATLSLPLFGLLSSAILYLPLCISAFLLAGVLLRSMRKATPDAARYRVSFAGVNVFVLVTMILLIVESGL